MTTKRRIAKPKADYAALADEHLSCREFRHAWQQTGPYRIEWQAVEGRKTKERFVVRDAVCIRCATKRTDRYNAQWRGAGRGYAYPEGYQFKGVDRGNITAEVHHEFYKRAVERYGLQETAQPHPLEGK